MVDMNRQVRYDEFTAIARRALLAEAASAQGMHYARGLKGMAHPGQGMWQKAGPQDRKWKQAPPSLADAEEWTRSEAFDRECKNLYAAAVQERLLEKEVFSLVECLERCMDWGGLGRDPWHLPLHNSYVPVRHTLMPRPDLSLKDDEMGYRYRNYADKTKTQEPIDPVAQLSPLKGTKMSPRPRH